MPKVVIDLSDKEYEDIKALDYLTIGRMNSKPLIFAALHGIKRGTVLPKVLEDIKAEIIKHHEIGCDMNCKNCKMLACIEPKDVIADLEIIDKHISGKESEDTE